MTINDYSDPIFDAIRTYLTANWTDTEIQWPNEESDISGTSPILKVDLTGTIYGQQSIGASIQADNRWDEEGILWLFLTVPRGSGFTQVRGAGKALSNIFRGLTLLGGSLEFMDASVGAGVDQEGAWYVLPVSIEWRYIDA